MDTDKFFKDLTNSKELVDIPIEHIVKVSLTILELLQDNKYIFKIGD